VGSQVVRKAFNIFQKCKDCARIRIAPSAYVVLTYHAYELEFIAASPKVKLSLLIPRENY